MRISDWSSDVCSSDLVVDIADHDTGHAASPPGMISLISLISNKLISDRSGPPGAVCDRPGTVPDHGRPPADCWGPPGTGRDRRRPLHPGASRRTTGSAAVPAISRQT